MSSNKSFLVDLRDEKTGIKATLSEARSVLNLAQKNRSKKTVLMAPSPNLHASQVHKGDRLPSIAAPPSSSRRVKKTGLLPGLVPIEEKQQPRLGAGRTFSRGEPASVKVPDIKHSNGLTRPRTPAYMRTRTTAAGKPRSPDPIPSGRNIGINLPRIE